MTVLKAIGILFVFFVLVHWLASGQDEIIEGPPETPETSFVQPSTTP